MVDSPSRDSTRERIDLECSLSIFRSLTQSKGEVLYKMTDKEISCVSSSILTVQPIYFDGSIYFDCASMTGDALLLLSLITAHSND